MSSRLRTGAPILLICLLVLGFPLSRAGAAEGLPENPPPELLCFLDLPAVIESFNAGKTAAKSRLREYVLIIPALITAAEAGSVQAASTLGMVYALRLRSKQDQADAVKWFRMAAERGEPYAQYNLGGCYLEGWGVGQDQAEAAKWYRLAAKQGLPAAQNNLGVLYGNGEGVPPGKAETMNWYRLAAELGDVKAQYYLGRCYTNGDGVGQDLAEAVKWYRLAAAQGHASAHYYLACYYVHGVSKDQYEAINWYPLPDQEPWSTESYAETSELLSLELAINRARRATRYFSHFPMCDIPRLMEPIGNWHEYGFFPDPYSEAGKKAVYSWDVALRDGGWHCRLRRVR
jgi:hypothetical protein